MFTKQIFIDCYWLHTLANLAVSFRHLKVVLKVFFHYFTIKDFS